LAFCLASAAVFASLPFGGAQAPDAAPEWLDARVDVTFLDLTHAHIVGAFEVHKAAVQGTAYTAQGLRDAHTQAARFGMAEAFVAQMDEALRGRAQAALAGVFPGANVTVEHAAVDHATLGGPRGQDPYHPTVNFAFDAAATYRLEDLGLGGDAAGIDEAQLRALLDMGVRATLPYNLVARPGWNLTYAFHLPDWLAFASAEGAALSPDGATATWQMSNWLGATDRTQAAALVLHSRGAPEGSASASDAQLDLTIDMRDVVDLSLPGVLAGDFGRLDVVLDARLALREVQLADVPALRALVAARLPSGVAVERINADALRMAVRDGLVPPDAMEQIEAQLAALASERAAAFGAEVGDLQGGFEPGTLDAALISNPPDGEPPLVFVLHGEVLLPLSSEPPRYGAAAALGPTLLERELSFGLPRVQGFDTTYRIVLPPGIALAAVAADGASYEESTQDGRDVVLVTPQSDDAQATFTIAVTSDFVLAKFWYVWVGALLAGALGAAAFLVRRRRKGRPQVAIEAKPAEQGEEPAPELAPLPASQQGSGAPAPRGQG
jgi:hypothetical protein